MLTPKKTNFGRKVIQNGKSSCGSTEEMDLGTNLIGTIPIFLGTRKIGLVATASSVVGEAKAAAMVLAGQSSEGSREDVDGFKAMR